VKVSTHLSKLVHPPHIILDRLMIYLTKIGLIFLVIDGIVNKKDRMKQLYQFFLFSKQFYHPFFFEGIFTTLLLNSLDILPHYTISTTTYTCGQLLFF